MSVSSWAEKYCSECSTLMLLYQPELSYICKSKGLTAELSRGSLSISSFLTNLSPAQLANPDFGDFSLYLERSYCIENVYCYHLQRISSSEDQSWELFANTMSKLHEVMLRLSQAPTLDDLYQQAIIEAQQHLFIDRLAILLLDTETNEMIGTWGTDEDGNVKDENAFRGPIPDAPWVELTLASKEHVEVWDNVDLLYYNKVVGKGWNAMAAIWDGDTPIGWIACDNLIKKRPMQPWLKEILGQYGQALGHTIVRFNNLKKLKDINDNLETLVAERSSQLQEKVEQLEKAQDELVESEKLASLGGLVAGVAHEVNTPVGIGVTAASHLVEEAKEISKQYQNKTMKKSDLEGYFEYTLDSGQLIQDNLLRASDLIKSFKQLAVEQTVDSIFEVNLFELVNNIQNSFHHQFKNRPITFINHIEKTIVFRACSGKLNQIITNLVNNSLIHAFDSEIKGTIEVKASIENGGLHLCYLDTGNGVDDETLQQLFEPFFTTKRGHGGTGLGLNIVYNIVKKLDGQIESSHVKPTGLQFDIFLPTEVNE
ncbi:HAMP domain-containing histidine kinase [Vibrio sp. ZSDE26]|uniref:histidine kinase n=1 Tax=Vibrio amylolyticus TaxID=2847292 RepID=A0A9X1XLB1_9VIBR|nr:HAMP domain-containing sensor histidine kinase [Vibrio amylolyticus]MCK6262960.1 HAMP domain-containing histidine kinase [Vibrio amylolyticus]